jgi:hypothetical protein
MQHTQTVLGGYGFLKMQTVLATVPPSIILALPFGGTSILLLASLSFNRR